MWLAAAQREQFQGVVLEIDFGANEASGPEGVGEVGMAQQIELAVVVSSSQVDDTSLQLSLKVEGPEGREAPTCRRCQQEVAMTMARGDYVACRAFAQFVQRGGEEAIPDFGLPEAIEGFDGGLKARFARRREDGSNAKAQAQTDNASESVGQIVGSLKAGVVVELSVVGQSRESPVLHEFIEDDVGDDALVRPGCGETTMVRYAGEDMNIVACGESESFDDVERIEFDAFVGEVREIPATRRRRTSNASLAIEEYAAQEDSSDGAEGRSGLAGVAQEELDGQSAAFAEITGQEEASDFDNTVFNVCREAARASGCRWLIAPIDAVKALRSGPSDPALDRLQGNAQAASDRPQGESLPSELNDLAPLTKRVVFWP